MARKTITRWRSRPKKRHSRPGFTFSTAVVAGFAPMVVDVIHGYQTGGFSSASNDLLANLTGYDARSKSWSFGTLMRGLGPVVLGVLVHKGANKLGVNRAIARAGIPFFRI